MHLTKSQLKQIIKEELVALYEGDGDDVLPISGTELQTIQHIAKLNGVDKGIMGVAYKVIANLGATNKNPKMIPVIKAFKKAFLPQLAALGKRVNIDIAEGIDLDFLDLLIEQGPRGVKKDRTGKVGMTAGEAEAGPLGKRQQAYRKGQARQRAGGGMAYFKSMGGKSPLIVRQLEKALRTALLKGVDVDSLLDAAAEVSDAIKDPKAKAQYEKRYADQLEKNPAKRIAIYKDSVEKVIGAVVALATKAAESAVSSAGPSDSKPGAEPAEAPQDTPTKVEDIPEEDIEAAKKLRMNPIEYVLLRSQAELGDKNAIQALSTRPRPEKHPFKEKKPGFFSKLKGMFKEELEKELVKKLKRGK